MQNQLDIILWDKTPPAAYAERVGGFYMLEKRSVEFYQSELVAFLANRKTEIGKSGFETSFIIFRLMKNKNSKRVSQNMFFKT